MQGKAMFSRDATGINMGLPAPFVAGSVILGLDPV